MCTRSPRAAALAALALGSATLDACAPECGDGPLVGTTARIVEFPTGTPLAGAELSTDLCPDLVVTSDWLGGTALRVPRGTPIVTHARAPGFVPMMTGELVLEADFDGGAPLFRDELRSGVPHLTSTSPAIIAITNVRRDVVSEGDPCASPDGIVFSVVDHPEAIVTYYGEAPAGGVPGLDPARTATSTSGAAEIGGLEETKLAADRVELRADKAGCDVSFVSYPHTGRYALVDGVLTAAAAYIPPFAAP